MYELFVPPPDQLSQLAAYGSHASTVVVVSVPVRVAIKKYP